MIKRREVGLVLLSMSLNHACSFGKKFCENFCLSTDIFSLSLKGCGKENPTRDVNEESTIT